MRLVGKVKIINCTAGLPCDMGLVRVGFSSNRTQEAEFVMEQVQT